MSLNKIIKLFGTDGIRGEAGTFPLDPATVRIIGKSLARRLAERGGNHRPRIIIGRDTRESGVWIERELINGISGAAAEVQSAGVITTPGVAFLARSLAVDAGVVISASHNPFQDNGIKIFDRSGRKLDDETERLIESDIDAATNNGIAPGPAIMSASVSNANDTSALQVRYIEYLVREVARDLSLGGMTIVVDCANGASSEFGPRLFERLGARVIAINNKPDGRNINRDCGSLHTGALSREVVKDSADLGVAFDGDADRALFVDLKGNLVDGDATLWIMAKYMQDAGALEHNTVVATVMSNIGLEIALRARAVKLIRTDVGDKYVLEELLNSGASLGGEQSGHIIFPKLSLAGDGLITTLQVLRAICDAGRPLHKLTEGFDRYPQILVNVPVSHKRPFDELPSVRRQALETERKLGERGRLLLRYSGTEPLARVMIEGERQEEIESYANALAETIRLALSA